MKSTCLKEVVSVLIQTSDVNFCALIIINGLDLSDIYL